MSPREDDAPRPPRWALALLEPAEIAALGPEHLRGPSEAPTPEQAATVAERELDCRRRHGVPVEQARHELVAIEDGVLVLAIPEVARGGVMRVGLHGELDVDLHRPCELCEQPAVLWERDQALCRWCGDQLPFDED